MSSRTHLWVMGIVVAAALAACSSGGGASTPSAAPASVAPASAAATGGVVEAKAVGNFPNIVVAGQGAKDSSGADKSGFTLYYFTKETAGSGQIACTDKCAGFWPPLTVAAGTTPSAGSGVTGTVGTVKRPDGTMQVTLNGQALYFFSKDTAAGQTNGYYPLWGVVNADGSLVAPPSAAPSSAGASGAASPAASSAASPAASGSPAASSGY